MRLGAVATALAMTAAGCSNGYTDPASNDGGGGGEEQEPITMGAIPGWTDQTGTTYLLKNILEENGYTVEVQQLTDMAPMFTALADGDVDILSSAWPERTHAAYMDEYGEELDDLGSYYQGASLYLAVPEYSDIQSIDELPSHAEELGGRIVGIEPGAGLTAATQDEVFPAYGLDSDFELVLSSTAPMLAELENAIEAEEPIVVTLWSPFWANLEYPVRPLEDPLGAYGESEDLHVLTRQGFSGDFPEVGAMLESFELDDEQFGSLEDMVVNDFGEDQAEEAAVAWLEENPEFGEALAEHLQD